MEYQDLRLIYRLALVVGDLISDNDELLETLNEIIKDARKLGGIHECEDDGLLPRTR